MIIKQARTIGRTLAMKSIMTGVFIAYFILVILLSGDGFIDALFWIGKVDFKTNLFIASFILLVMGYVIGGIAGEKIIIEKKNPVVIGILSSFLIVFISSLISSLFAFMQQIFYSNSNVEIEAYLVRPLVIICSIGLIPITILGSLYGVKIKKKGARHNTTRN